ncbi:hypothetical protein V5O48_018983, partial [Marasmius crinis-equi]
MSTAIATDNHSGNNSPVGGALQLNIAPSPMPLPGEGTSRADASRNWRPGQHEMESTRSLTPTQRVSMEKGKHFEPGTDIKVPQPTLSWQKPSRLNAPGTPSIGINPNAPGAEHAASSGTSGHRFTTAFPGGNTDQTIGHLADDSMNWETRYVSVNKTASPLSAHSNISRVSHESPSRAISVMSNRERTQLKSLIGDIGGVVQELQQSVRSDQLSIANKFAIELSKVSSAHENRFKKLKACLDSIEHKIGTQTSLPSTPLAEKISVAPILRPDYDPTIALLEKAIEESDNKRRYGYKDMYREVFGIGPGSDHAESVASVASTHRELNPSNPTNNVMPATEPIMPDNVAQAASFHNPARPIQQSSPMFYP